MSDFFKGWRRKAGCVTLVLALLLMGAWGRSFGYDNWLILRGDDHTFNRLVSFQGSVDWERVSSDSQKQWTADDYRGRALAMLMIAKQDKRHTIDWRWNAWGLAQGEYRSPFLEEITDPDERRSMDSLKVWRISYWFIITPLSLLSTCLLLSKPRQSTPKKITEPIPETVA